MKEALNIIGMAALLLAVICLAMGLGASATVDRYLFLYAAISTALGGVIFLAFGTAVGLLERIAESTELAVKHLRPAAAVTAVPTELNQEHTDERPLYRGEYKGAQWWEYTDGQIIATIDGATREFRNYDDFDDYVRRR